MTRNETLREVVLAIGLGIVAVSFPTKSLADSRQGAESTPHAELYYPPVEVAPGRTRFNHISVRVADLERSIVFYTTYLGFRLIRTQDIGFLKTAFISTGDGEPLIELNQAKQLQPDKIGLDFGHIGVFVADVDAVFAKLAAAGIKAERKPMRPGPGAPYFGFVKDPDGYKIEVMENPNPAECTSCHRTPHLD